MSFSDNHFDGITIPSVWKSHTIVAESQTQTEEIKTEESGISLISTNNVEIQTTDVIDSHKTRPLKTFNSPELTKFVAKASKITIGIIEKTKEQNIIHRIERFQNQSKANVRMVSKFHKQLNSMSDTNNQLDYNVSSICWNCSASVLGAGYAVKVHTDWCTHPSYVLFWNLFKTSRSEDPSVVLEIDSCVSTLISHSKQPNIYFSGAFNGKVCVWNTRNTDDYQMTSVMAHQSTVTALHWIESNERSDFGLLVSSGLDGKVLVWKVNDKSIQMEQSFVVLAQDMPKTMQIKRDNSEVGIVSMSFNYDDPNIFIIGCIGGALFQCSLISRKPILSKKEILSSNEIKDMEYKSPIVMSYASHRSHIKAIQFCPNSRNIFFSCSSDSELRIYNILQTIPLIVIHTEVPLVSGQWSPSRPHIAAVGTDGKVYIYFITDTKVSKASISFAIGDQIRAESLVYNTIENNEQIAVIASNQQIQVWDLFSASENTDNKDVNKILNELTND